MARVGPQRHRKQNKTRVIRASGCQLVLHGEEDGGVCVAVEGVASLLRGLTFWRRNYFFF